MAHNNCFPTFVRHTLARTGTLCSRRLLPGNCEALLVTTCWPLKNFTVKIESEPELSSQPPTDRRNHRVNASVRPKNLEFFEEDVVLCPKARELVFEDEEFSDALKCRILIWNCTGICHCRFEEALQYIHRDSGVNIAVIVGGPPHEETTTGFWGGLGLREGIPGDFDFDSRGPAVTVRYDESLMEVAYLDFLRGDDERSRVLNVFVDRPRYVQGIEWALRWRMEESSNESESSDESDSE